MHREELLQKIEFKTAVLGVIGLGYVGLPLAVEKAKAGYRTIGFDIQDAKVDLVNAGENYIGDVVDEDLKSLVESGMLRATSDFSFVKDLDVLAICVPTPLTSHKDPDISYVVKSAEEIAAYIHPGMLIVLESTTYPGTTEEVLKPILETSGFACGKDFFLAFSPERVDPGNALYKTKNTPKVVGGVDAASTEVAAALYRHILAGEVFPVSSPRVAEMEKILENTYRNVNIALVNEFTLLCNKMDIDMWEVVDAAKTKPYGFQAFYPGPGVGGHCIPLDPFYLTWKAREYDMKMTMIETAGAVNDAMPSYVVTRIARGLSRRFRKALNGAKVLMLGMAYKKDIDDLRDSPALTIYELLLEEGAAVDYYDALNPTFRDARGETVHSVEKLTPEIFRNYDAVLITTDHSTVDYDAVVRSAPYVFDTKNATRGMDSDVVERL